MQGAIEAALQLSGVGQGRQEGVVGGGVGGGITQRGTGGGQRGDPAGGIEEDCPVTAVPVATTLHVKEAHRSLGRPRGAEPYFPYPPNPSVQSRQDDPGTARLSTNCAGEATIPTTTPAQPDPSLFELGHQGEFDRTQIARFLAMSPTERLRHYDSWRAFVEECHQRAELRRKNHRRAGESAKVEFVVVGGISTAMMHGSLIVGRAVEMEVAGHTVKVLSLADLIRTKRAAGRPKDLAVLPTLEATLQMQQEQDGD